MNWDFVVDAMCQDWSSPQIGLKTRTVRGGWDIGRLAAAAPACARTRFKRQHTFDSVKRKKSKMYDLSKFVWPKSKVRIGPYFSCVNVTNLDCIV